MLDVLSSVYQFVQTHAAEGDDLPAYENEQIIRGNQNSAVLPAGFNEYCIITLMNSVRHGTTGQTYDYTESGDAFSIVHNETLEHIIQVDFYGAPPDVEPYQVARRAQIIEMLMRSEIATAYFESLTDGALTALYADDIQNLTGFDETKTLYQHYHLTLHLCERSTHAVNADYFNQAQIHVENVNEHHKIN